MPQKEQTKSKTGIAGSGATSHWKITPELVRQITERVYRMMRDELILARERSRSNNASRPGGVRR